MDSIKVRLGNNVQTYRKRAGLKQADLASAVGINVATISLLEGGKAWPQYENLEAIAKVLSIPISVLFEGHRELVMPTPQEALAVLADFVSRATLAPIKEVPGDPDDLAERLTLASPITRDLICAALEGDAIGKEKSVRRLVQKLRNHSND